MTTVLSKYGLKCPNCSADDDLHIRAERRIWVKLFPDHLEDEEEERTDWNNDCAAECHACEGDLVATQHEKEGSAYAQRITVRGNRTVEKDPTRTSRSRGPTVSRDASMAGPIGSSALLPRATFATARGIGTWSLPWRIQS